MAEPEDDESARREQVARRLRAAREEVRERALLAGPSRPDLPPAREPQLPPVTPMAAAPERPQPPPRPDGAAVNDLWRATPVFPRGPKGWLGRLLWSLLRPAHEAQVAFNSRQVQLDNQLFDWVEGRFAATHGHYDAVLGQHGRHLGEADTRHMILQEELVAHVHDLVRRIDLVLADSERGRHGLEFALRDLRERLRALEERLPRA